jgi:hypothetical protein
VRQSCQPIDHHEDRLWVDSPPPELFQHVQCYVPRVKEGDLHPVALDHHPWIIEPRLASHLRGEVGQVGHSQEPMGQQELFEV